MAPTKPGCISLSGSNCFSPKWSLSCKLFSLACWPREGLLVLPAGTVGREGLTNKASDTLVYLLAFGDDWKSVFFFFFFFFLQTVGIR